MKLLLQQLTGGPWRAGSKPAHKPGCSPRSLWQSQAALRSLPCWMRLTHYPMDRLPCCLQSSMPFG